MTNIHSIPKPFFLIIKSACVLHNSVFCAHLPTTVRALRLSGSSPALNWDSPWGRSFSSLLQMPQISCQRPSPVHTHPHRYPWLASSQRRCLSSFQVSVWSWCSPAWWIYRLTGGAVWSTFPRGPGFRLWTAVFGLQGWRQWDRHWERAGR